MVVTVRLPASVLKERPSFALELALLQVRLYELALKERHIIAQGFSPILYYTVLTGLTDTDKRW